MKNLAALAALFAAAAQAQTSSIQWELRPGGTRTATQAQCDAAARARNVTAEYQCERIVRVTAAPQPPAPPPPSPPPPAPPPPAPPPGATVGGNAAMVIHAAVNALIEGNVMWSNQPEHGQAGIVTGGVGDSGGGDEPMTGGTIRNNTACYNPPGANQTVVRNSSPGATLTNNVMRTGADASTGVCAR